MSKPRSVTIYTTPADAAIAFYQAFETKDLEAMMNTWAEDEEIICIHPGGARMVGYDAVRAGWEQIFARESRLSFRLDEVITIETVGLATQSAVEQITMGKEGSAQGSAIATNVFMRTPYGWRMVMHHASSAPPVSNSESKGPLH